MTTIQVTPMLRRRTPRHRFAPILFAGLAVCVSGCGMFGGGGGNDRRSAERERVSLQRVLDADEATQRAKLLMSSGRLREALAQFERAVDLNPGAVEAHMGIGEIYKQEGDLTRAEASYRRAAEAGPDVFEARYSHALVLQLMGRHQEAIRAYLGALQLNPRDFDANMNIGLAFVQIGRPDQGLPYAQRAVRLDPRSGPAHHNLGVCYAMLERHEDAIASFRTASEYMGLSPQLLLALADSQSALNRYDDATSTLERLIRTDPSADAHRRLGTAYFRTRRYDESLAAFRTALEYDDRHYTAHNGVAVCLLNTYLWSNKTDTDALEGAIDAMRRSLRIKRDQPEIIELLTRFG
ncbi:MAG: tetratricopeptide repeat protein [Phycisphaerales bacterium]